MVPNRILTPARTLTQKRIMSPTRRASITGATFSRASEAYDSLGRIALPGLPRLEYATGVGWVTWAEEATTNIASSDPSFETGVNGFVTYASVATIAKSTDCAFSGSYSLKLTYTSSNTATSGIARWFTSITAYQGVTLTLSMMVRGTGSAVGKTVYANIYDNVNGSTKGTVVTLTGEWQKISVTKTIASTATTMAIYWLSSTLTTDDVVYTDIVMLEPKAYPTSFCLSGSPRAAESLTMPTDGLSVSEGTIEGIFKATSVIKRKDGSTYPRIFELPGTSGYIRLMHDYSTAYWYLVTSDGTNVASATMADSYTANDYYYYYKVYWTGGTAVVEIWSLSTKTKVASATISAAYLPSTLGSYLYIGSDSTPANYGNVPFGRHRMSSIARTTNPDFDDLMPDDDYTVGIFDPTPVYNHLTA